MKTGGNEFASKWLRAATRMLGAGVRELVCLLSCT